MQEERVQFARYGYKCSLQDDSLEGTDIDTVCKNVTQSPSAKCVQRRVQVSKTCLAPVGLPSLLEIIEEG